jgi:hypothetical protein
MPSICSPANQAARQFATIIASGFRSVKELAAIADLSASLLIIKAPDGVRPLRVMAGTSPVPLAAIAKHDVHAQHPLDADFSSVRPTRPQFPALRHFNLVLEFNLIIRISAKHRMLNQAILLIQPALDPPQISDLSRVQSYLSSDAT